MTKPTTSRPYDPYAHAEALGLPVAWDDARGHLGYWDGHTIHLAHDLRDREARCVLAHEIVHAEHDDRPTRDHQFSARRERRADRIAAERLIDPEALRTAKAWSDDPGQVAIDLDVTGWVLCEYTRTRPWLQLRAG